MQSCKQRLRLSQFEYFENKFNHNGVIFYNKDIPI